MTNVKKCAGCGSILQTTDKKALGFTPKIENILCMRCFKLKHYGNLINPGKKQDNDILLKKINQKNKYVIFVVDFLNVYSDVINIYQKIKQPKCLVITKSDIIPKNIKKDKLLANIKRVYNIKENILLVSAKSKENLKTLATICLENKEVVLAGFSNAGKSSLINALIGSDITVSRSLNTTQEFIKLTTPEFNIYDAPGFIISYAYADVAHNTLKPKIYQLQNKYYLKIADLKIASLTDNNLSIYLNNDMVVAKRKIKEQLTYNLKIPAKHDLVIKGLGFIVFSQAAVVALDIASDDYYEVRPTIIGGSNENKSNERKSCQ